MENDFFTGSFETLHLYWQDADRAIRFRKGGTRTAAVDYIIARIETDIHKGSWLDIACGAGFVQTRISDSVGPTLVVGLDFSRVMLNQVDETGVHRILGSAFDLPVRSSGVTLTTNFFSLSDYPDITPAFEEMARVIKESGTFVHVDYASTDEYWKTRTQLHDTLDNEDKKITGNIHLRTLDDISKAIPEGYRITEQKIIEYQVESSEINTQFDLPATITRRFLFTEVYKPRSIKYL